MRIYELWPINLADLVPIDTEAERLLPTTIANDQSLYRSLSLSVLASIESLVADGDRGPCEIATDRGLARASRPIVRGRRDVTQHAGSGVCGRRRPAVRRLAPPSRSRRRDLGPSGSCGWLTRGSGDHAGLCTHNNHDGLRRRGKDGGAECATCRHDVGPAA